MLSDYQVVLGAEAAIWTEQASSSNMLTRLFPRTWALAERLWSNPPVVSNYSSWEYGVYMLGAIHKKCGQEKRGGQEEADTWGKGGIKQKRTSTFGSKVKHLILSLTNEKF